MACIEGRDPYDDYVTINEELKAYDEKLMDRPQIIAANKMDMPGADSNLEKFKSRLSRDVDVHAISALTKDGLRNVLFAVADTLDSIPKISTEIKEDEDKVVYRHVEKEEPFRVSRDIRSEEHTSELQSRGHLV